MWIVTVLPALILVLLALFYIMRKRQHTVFQIMGIPGPKPHWLYGNMGDLKGKMSHEVFVAWTEKYGKVFGYFEGPTPILVTSDLEILKEVFVKQFQNFHGRKVFPVQPNPDKDHKMSHMFARRGEGWKRLRLITNPTFTAAKLKLLVPLMQSKVSTLLNIIKDAAEANRAVDAVDLYQGLTMDTIGEAAFGIAVNSQLDKSEPILKHCRGLFAQLEKKMLILDLATLFPELKVVFAMLFELLVYFIGLPHKFLYEIMLGVIDERRKENVRRNDLLQLMIDADSSSVASEGISSGSSWENDPLTNSNEGISKLHDTKLRRSKLSQSSLEETIEQARNAASLDSFRPTSKSGTKSGSNKLSADEIAAQSFLFILAGYETTSNALSYTTYLLATNPEKQALLRAEIDNFVADFGDGEDDLPFDSINRLPYLDMVIWETLRLYPIAAILTNRLCMNDCLVNGLRIPAGTVVQPDIWSIHHDAELWGPDLDPYSFEPERFTPDKKARRHPLAWLPFGMGPRNCVGMRFALMEVKITLVRVVQQFNIVACSETQSPLVVKEAATIAPRNGVMVKFVARK